MIIAYHYSDDGMWDQTSRIIESEDELQVNETTVVPVDGNGAGMYKPKFDTTTQKWVETLTADEIAKMSDVEPAQTQEQKDIAALKQENQQLKVMVNSLALKQAQQNAKGGLVNG